MAVVKARQYALAGISIGGFGLAYAVWFSHPLAVAFCGVLWGATLTLAVVTWRETRSPPRG